VWGSPRIDSRPKKGARRLRLGVSGARAPANGRRGLVDTRAGGVEYVLGRVSGGSHGAGDERNRGCGAGF
jgi:hypothetical protein